MDRLLQIKLTVPRPSQRLISRPRLIALLDGTLGARLLLLSAPPGFGKTTALVDWLAASGTRCAWLSLDAADNDPVRFLRYLWAAVANVAADGASSLVGDGRAADVPEAIGEVATILADRPDPSLLVLDDYHLIEAAEVQRAVSILLDRLPAQAHLVIATRVDPALPLARLRARGELLEVRADALRFTSEEARSFFAERMGLALSDADVETLVARTEGWPAVLQLAGLSLTGRGWRLEPRPRVRRDPPLRPGLHRRGGPRASRSRRERVPAADLGAGPAHRTAVRRAHRRDRWPGHARASRAVQPAHRAPR